MGQELGGREGALVGVKLHQGDAHVDGSFFQTKLGLDRVAGTQRNLVFHHDVTCRMIDTQQSAGKGC